MASRDRFAGLKEMVVSRRHSRKPIFILLVLTDTIWLLQADNSFDTSVCSPSLPGPDAVPPPAIQSEIWLAQIEWKNPLNGHTVLITDYFDLPNKRETILISPPYVNDVKLYVDYNTLAVTVIQGNNDQRVCQVVNTQTEHFYSYQDHFWLTSFNMQTKEFFSSGDVVSKGETTVRGIPVSHWTACLFDYISNTTKRADLYFTNSAWMSPFQPPEFMMPVRLEYFARQHNGSTVTDYNVTGDIFQFKILDTIQTDIFVTEPGVYCPNRTASLYMRLPEFPERFSLLMEVIDVDLHHVSYEQLWYDNLFKMVRWDFKQVEDKDDDPYSYIFDFNVGVKYRIDRHMMHCDPPSSLVVGDEFVNSTLGMKSSSTYFRSAKADIEYIGQITVRNVMCDTWIGHYFDQDVNRDVRVQWYFTSKLWTEATGNIEGSGEFFRMDIWNGDSPNPKIYNVLRFEPSAPDMGVFDFAVCYDASRKKHFTAEFKVLQNADRFSQLSGPYLKETMVQQLASRLLITVNRFTDVTFDFDGQNTLFVSAIMLDRAAASTQAEIGLEGAFDFLRGSIVSANLPIYLYDATNYPIPLEGINLVEHNFQAEFATTTTTIPSTVFLIPTPLPDQTPSMLIPTIGSLSSTHPPVSSPACICPTASHAAIPAPTCPPQQSCSCPSQTPCPTVNCTSGLQPCRCPNATISPPCKPTLSTSCPNPICPQQKPCLTSVRPPRTSCPPVPECRCDHLLSSTGYPPTQKPCHCPATPILTCQPGSLPCRCPTQVSQIPCSTPPPCPQGTNSTDFHSRHRLGDQQLPQNSSGVSTGALVGGVLSALAMGLFLGFVGTRLYHLKKGNPNWLTINIIENEKDSKY